MNDSVANAMIELGAVEIKAVVAGASRSKGFGFVAEAKRCALKENPSQLVISKPDAKKLYVGSYPGILAWAV